MSAEKLICVRCVFADELSEIIVRGGGANECSYCRTPSANAAPASYLFPFMENQLNELYRKTDELSNHELAMFYIEKNEDIIVQPIYILIRESLHCGVDEFKEDFIKWLENTWEGTSNYTAHYFEDDGRRECNVYEKKWASFVNRIQHGYRFFNNDAKEFLDEVFIDIGPSMFFKIQQELTPETTLFRGRIANDSKTLADIAHAPQQELGPPPSQIAGSQRMTPQGIAAMYCALDTATCLSELRAIAGDTVAVAAFRPTSNLYVIDLNKLEDSITICSSQFEAGHRKKVHAREFVRNLVEKISKPKGRQDELSYISTQAFFEYLRIRFGPDIDGLSYPSVQTNRTGKNVVFFPTPCLVKETEIDVAYNRNWNLINFSKLNKLEYVTNSLTLCKVRGVTTLYSELPNQL